MTSTPKLCFVLEKEQEIKILALVRCTKYKRFKWKANIKYLNLKSVAECYRSPIGGA